MWKVTVHTSNSGPVKLDFRNPTAKTHKAALEIAIRLAAFDAAMHAQALKYNAQRDADDVRRDHEHKRDALLGLIETLWVELHKPARKRWYNSPDCTRFSFEETRLAFANFERV